MSVDIPIRRIPWVLMSVSLVTIALVICLLRLAGPWKTQDTEPAQAAMAHAPDTHVLVIDPGHGGLDGGAQSATGALESEINLAIAQKVYALSQLWGLHAVMTRQSEELDYPETARSVHEKKVWDQKSRVDLINSTDNAVLLSIHQNTYPDPRPQGTQVLYARTTGSDRFGEITHQLLIETLNPDNRRVATPISDKIYLMRKIQCPGILVECGFLSNAQEAERLQDDTYQGQLAAVLLTAYVRYLDGMQLEQSPVPVAGEK